MATPVIVAAVRTPIGRFGGFFKDLPAWRLGASAIAGALSRVGLEPAAVEDVIMGNVLQAGQGMNPARRASMTAGLPDSVPAVTVNMVCGSGLRAVVMAAQAIALGEAQIVVAGGMESMSQAPYLLTGARFGYRLGHGMLVDSLLAEGLTDAFHDCHMGITAENIAREYGIGREEQDRYAVESQRRAALAWETGAFADEIIPVEVPGRQGSELVTRDEHPRPETTLEGLLRLRPAFDPAGTVTAGNASGINDGAAALVVMAEERARALGLEPLARIRSWAWAGVPPRVMGLGPIPALRQALARAELRIEDLDLYEVNEAFAVQVLAVQRELGLDPQRLNIYGGAIALGHPIGASGARILVTLVHALRRTGGRYGAAALCIGGGMGIAVIVERP
ncbi:acetyl-CoA C-acetyltransferase [Thermomicrobium roseum]|uniref:Acetyl-CoA acetyltransferase n=1 Tax=Thermomicrobium roseum (strain ATCC 27502 / DSM 5159 / P-2) TaxID=309801 RepID=B9KZ03_THERP|nr:acetyl-CoA C-acetyltransferase [Thermomicrobium roseum]ACM05195.1 acetyl-CoA acetyltransferase [Thermomicrobium roseum DSM 5159]